MTMRKGSTHGWAHLAAARKRDLIDSILANRATAGPAHLELDLTDRCNVECYFCNQQDTRSKLQLPFERVVEMIDELAERGLRSVRLSGGGDPLHHNEILPVLDHLAERSVVVDNLTTNAVSLTPAVADRLVAHGTREVNVSLNAADGEDYQRMMTVKPAIFDRVLANTRHLLERRGDAPWPLVSVQFLLDRANAQRVDEMYRLADELGADRVIISAVQQIAGDGIDPERVLHAEDGERLQPIFTNLFRVATDRELEVNLGTQGLEPMVQAARREAGNEPPEAFATAPSFRDQDGACFFSWYSAAVTGNGNVYPCCQLIQPGGPVMGNVLSEDVAEVWEGQSFAQLRTEMRQVMLDGAGREQPTERFKVLQPVCHRPGACWLKNIYFRADESFYRDLAAALDEERSRRDRLQSFRDRAESLLHRFPALRTSYDLLRNSTRPARRWLRRRFGLAVAERG